MIPNKLRTPLILVSVLLALALGFGAWAFISRQDYKNNSDQKAAVAVEQAKEETRAEEAAKFAEQEKSPLKNYTGPSDFGGISVQYPKTWSAYVEESTRGSQLIDGYFYPGFVPDASVASNTFALRIEVVGTSYDRVLDSFASQVRNGTVRVSPYQLPQMGAVTGSRVDGEVVRNKQGSMVIMPMRNYTLKIWTENEQFLADFNNSVLATLTFTP